MESQPCQITRQETNRLVPSDRPWEPAVDAPTCWPLLSGGWGGGAILGLVALKSGLVTVNSPDEDLTGAIWHLNVLKMLGTWGFMGAVFGWMLRRFSNLAVGAGVPSSVQVIEVEVDTWLGHVRVLNVHTGIAVGKIAAPALARSQAAGSIVQGIGYALYEAREVDPSRGNILTAGLEDYRIPGIADTPNIDVHFDEAGFDHVLGGSVGIGEVATIPTSPAIANAIRNAIGVRANALPIRPDRLITLLNQRSVA